MRAWVAAAFIGLVSMQAMALPRSQAAKAEFQRSNPCPATGKSRGACQGWQIDHIIPLKCGGADSSANMQWLTIEQHKQKTAREAKLCRH